jgi:small subunit ribosomal protein S11
MLVKNKFAMIKINNNTNNSFITICDSYNKVLFSCGAGSLKLKGSKRSTSFAAQNLAFFLSLKAFKTGFRFVQVFFTGFSKNREAVLKGIMLANLKVILIKDFTRIPFNGCKKKKIRRILAR